MLYDHRKLLRYLSKHTKVSWQEISPFYLDFRQNYTIHDYFCVMKPYTGDGRRASDMTGYYVPNDRRYCSRPRDFYEAYFGNSKAPYRPVGVEFEIDLEKGMPGFVVYKGGVFQRKSVLVKIEVDLFGKIKFYNNNSKNLALSSSIVLNNARLVKELSFKLFESFDIFFNLNERKFSLTSSFFNKSFALSTIDLTSLTTFTVRLSSHPIKFQMGSWLVSGKLGYQVKGTIMSDDDGELAKKYPVKLFSDKSTPVNREGFWHRVGAVAVIILVAVEDFGVEALPFLLSLA